jgi:hypothetical protein
MASEMWYERINTAINKLIAIRDEQQMLDNMLARGVTVPAQEYETRLDAERVAAVEELDRLNRAEERPIREDTVVRLDGSEE